MSFTLHVEVGAFGSSISKTSRNLLLLTASSFCAKRLQLTAITKRAGLILQLRDQKNTNYHPKQATQCVRDLLGLLSQGHWTILNARGIHVTSSGIFHFAEMPGKANHLLLPQVLQWVAETQAKWMPASPVLCEWEPQKCWCPRFFSK